VLSKKWGYPNIHKIAQKRFVDKNSRITKGSIIASCERLKLQLHESLRRGGNKQKSNPFNAHDPFVVMAVWIESIGMKQDAWLAGQRGLWEQ